MQPIPWRIQAIGSDLPPHWRVAIENSGDLLLVSDSADIAILFGDSPPPAASYGIVRIGGIGEADASLTADAGPGEMVLACRLVGQIASLRRQLHHAELTRCDLAEKAMTDPLTGLPNRRAWDDVLAARSRETPDGVRLAVVLIDLDRFKPVNDQHGHLAGDSVLCRTAKALRTALRSSDFIARFGGDEFGLLLWVPDAATAVRVVERALAAVRDELADIPLTASAGIAMTSDRAVSPVATADAALCQAKNAGRNRAHLSAV